MTDKHQRILKSVDDYYSDKIQSHGATHWGVDWNSTETQVLRFEQLLKLHRDSSEPFSINDYGCGYGALIDYLHSRNFNFDYTGFDISAAMLEHARQLFAGQGRCAFVDQDGLLNPASYTVASGIFNVRLQTDDASWQAYVLDTIERMWAISEKGMAFNMLTKYSDAEYMKPYLYYADPCFLFDYCKTRYSRQVALLHDYGLYEFTLIVRR